ncbi:hypothetical protein [Achromobacter sp. ESBL13]|uniref:hypothetical protein n=1 Tax=Achromobacter sp. ESBL13 TaxID=3077328 RepID=UPI002FC64DC6
MGYESATDRAIQIVLTKVRDHFLANRSSMESDDVFSAFSLAPGWQDFDPRNTSLAARPQEHAMPSPSDFPTTTIQRLLKATFKATSPPRAT